MMNVVLALNTALMTRSIHSYSNRPLSGYLHAVRWDYLRTFLPRRRVRFPGGSGVGRPET